MQPSSDFTPTTELLQGSPKMMYTYFLLNEGKEYLRGMRNPDTINVDTATASLLAYCPDVKVRDRLWTKYLERKANADLDVITASILTIGDFNAYLSEVLEFTEKSSAGF